MYIRTKNQYHMYDGILVMVDQFSKFTHMVPTVGTVITLETTKLFLNAWCHHGLPKMIGLN